MPLSKAHKARTRAQIVAAAGTLFRRHGYEGVSVNAIMAEAGLTRGGFYAHFASKEELFATVLRESHDLVRRLAERKHTTPEALAQSCADVMNAYLDPLNFEKVAPNCTMSALNADAARSSSEARTGFTRAISRLHDEIARGMPPSGEKQFNDRALVSVSLAVGALSLARSSSDQELAIALLTAAQNQVREWCEDRDSRSP